MNYKISLFPGNPDLKRLYYDDNKLNILSIISSAMPCLNIIFLHGGPESLEWDNPHLPLVINSFSKANVNFHILNYAGSKGFGRHYRESVNQNVLEGMITPIINWINKFSPHTHLAVIGGSFGGTLALELLTNAYKIDTNILALALTNPLIDLPFHMRRVQEKGGDLSFFLRKFSPSDISSITVKRYACTLIMSKVKTLLLLGRHDEILTIKPAITLLKKLKGTQNVTAYIDDGTHSSLQFSLIREKKMVNFLAEILQLCCAIN
ncbi:MAG: alpha/beta fold hydrolase [Candidatus Symbiodolus clandestinus]